MNRWVTETRHDEYFHMAGREDDKGYCQKGAGTASSGKSHSGRNEVDLPGLASKEVKEDHRV